jgi:hypothetical protein
VVVSGRVSGQYEIDNNSSDVNSVLENMHRGRRFDVIRDHHSPILGTFS